MLWAFYLSMPVEPIALLFLNPNNIYSSIAEVSDYE